MTLLSGRCLTLTILLLLWSCSLGASVQQVYRLSPDNGLSQGVVNRLSLDQHQQLWLATDGGLDRFDGYQSRQLHHDLLSPNTPVYDIQWVSPTLLHIATFSQGLLQLDITTQQVSQLQQVDTELDDIFDDVIYLIHAASNNQVYYADSAGVYIQHDDDFHQVFQLDSSDIHKHFISAILDIEHYLLIATSQGLWLHDTQKQQSWQLHYLSAPNSDQHYSKSLYLDEVYLYVGTVEGLYAIKRHDLLQLPQDATEMVVEAETLLHEENIWRIRAAADAMDTLFLATNNGLLELNTTSKKATILFQPSQTQQPFFDNSILDFVQDIHGNFWLASRGDGAYYWQPSANDFLNIQNTASATPLSHPFVYSLVADEQALWIGSQNGLNRYDLTQQTTDWFLVNPDQKAVESSSTIYSMAALSDNDSLWLMTAEGIQLFSRDQQQLLAMPETTQHLLAHTPYSMVLDGVDNLYLHNEAGFYRVSPRLETTALSQLSEQLTQDYASHWVGIHPADDSQLLLYDNFTLWAYHPDSQQLESLYTLPRGYRQSSAYIEGIQLLGDSLWLLFQGIGLVELDSISYQTKQQLFGSQALPTSTLYQMHQDDFGYLWMSSHSGLWRYNPKVGSFRQFTSQQGLAYNEFNGMSSTKLRDGRLAFGSLKGVSLLHPEAFHQVALSSPEVKFSHISLLSRKLPDLLQPAADHQLTLKHDDYGLQVHISTFNYQQQSTRYYFQLDGPSKIPEFATRESYLLLPQLLAGNYKLTVRAFDPVTEQYSQTATLRFQVEYAPWTSPLAKLIYLVLAALSITGWLYWRHQQKQVLLQQNKQLQQSQQRLQLALDIADSDVWSWRHASNTLLHPQRLYLMTGRKDEVEDFEHYLGRIHPNDQADYLHGWKELCTGLNDHFQQTYRVQDHTGKWHWFKDIGKVTQMQHGKALQVSGIYTNITAQKLTEQELEQLIHYDGLTQLPNRTFLLQQLDEQIANHPDTAFSLLFIDLDRFKHINDSMGHEHGNTLLKAIAARLQSQVHAGDMLAHLGSDEFVFLLGHTDAQTLEHKVQTLQALIAQPVMVDQQLVSISCSVGIACYPEHGNRGYDVLKFADIAMAYAKRHGELEFAVFESYMPERTRQKMQLEHQLKQAIQQQQLQNYYQPIVDSLSGRAIGIELLLRWNNQGRMVPPDQFIPMAEELDLIGELAWNSLQRALHDLQRIHQQGYPLYLSVNLSASQLNSDFLTTRLAELIEQGALDPSFLRLEITETALMRNRIQASHTMHQLKKMGIQLYLDDFGTGYSSLTYLKDFPIDLIKIDRSFVSDLQPGSQNAILNTIIALAQNMSLPCIAEGVETEYQLNYLKQQQCHLIQGYWYSAPMPKKRLLEYLSSERGVL
ncbi:EAL domain-containing protein [Alkalimonas collagenimarina]|uniref:EAL domain-containing protein n=1 Tax=Alkalimonas collagenimarina TaxID=400390 RepID=A0ABT9GWA9_9GAMM|nr:EAL domain-containing protein [Alkalimonas collagenimarina]MDP4535339.1 EAL domain-containing protein [Alkalimonas collagenimarina]